MNECEARFSERFLSEGYEVIQGGWPDFLIVKGGEACFVEVKQADKLSCFQKRTLHALASLGLNVCVYIDERFVSLEDFERNYYAFKGKVRKRIEGRKNRRSYA